jgi:hypothetical protein
MPIIEKQFDDYSQPNNKGLVRLRSDQPIVLSGQKWPIVWSGHVNGIEVSVIQESGSSSDPDTYELKDFPPRYKWLKAVIVNLIDGEFRQID